MTPRKRARSLVVVAWDGSPAAATAFPVARMIGAQLGADVEILLWEGKTNPYLRTRVVDWRPALT